LKHLSRRLRQPRHLQDAQAVIREHQARKASLAEWVDLALDFPSRGNVKIRTVQRPTEINALVAAVAALEPERILEIGTYRAGTLLLWSQLASKRVVTCDIEVPAHMVPLYQEFPPPASLCTVEILEGDSHRTEFRERAAEAIGGPVDFLFIDGDHSAAGVQQDYEMYHDLVRPGGLIAFHDIVPDQPVPGNQVHHFWHKLRAELPPERVREFIEDPEQCGYGIGVVTSR
jgi:predicted O-methyltransferase YrrM